MHYRYLVAMWTLGLLNLSCPSIAVSANVTVSNDSTGVGLPVKNFKQFEGGWQEDLVNGISGKPMTDKGCIITDMTNILYYHGLKWIPDDNHEADTLSPINPRSFNKYLMKPSIKGYKTGTAEVYPGATKKFYYKNTPFYNWYKAVVPNDDCWPFSNESDFRCFQVDWSDYKAEAFLVNDLYSGQPDILNIKGYYEKPKTGTNLIELKTYDSHFVVASGYSTIYPSDPYHVEDPGRGYKTWMLGIPLAALYPKLSDRYRTTQLAVFGENRPAYKILGVRRYTDGYGEGTPNLSWLGTTVHSPVEIQMIDPKGRITGYDPISGTMFKDNPKGLYYSETVSSIDSEDPPEEPTKTLWINEPIAGNYILKIFGTGDGPYTIDLDGENTEGITNLRSSITGTATASLYETYRVTYSPTGEANLSQSNQAPVANVGANQTGEQSYEIQLDGSATTDPDGDPLKYSWSYVSRPDGSSAALSDANAISPTFTPDLPGTYVLQLVVNDYFTDSAPSTVTVSALPIKSRVSVTPDFSAPLTAGPGALAFHVNNIGRIGVSSGMIDMTLKDPTGNTVSAGSRAFTLATGQTATVSIPVTIHSLKFGDYALTYTQSDETRVGSQTNVTIPNTAVIALSLDKPSYKVRETANLMVELMNTGKFNLDPSTGLTLTVAAPSAGYTDARTISIGQGQVLPFQYAIQIPDAVPGGQHDVNVTLSLPSGSSIAQISKVAVPESLLSIWHSGSSTLNAGDAINLTIQNAGGVDTTYTAEKLTITDDIGLIIYQGNIAGTIMSGESKTVTDIKIPAQTASGRAILDVKLKDTKSGKFASLRSYFSVIGLEAGLTARTDKDAYLNTDAITALTTLTSGAFAIENGSMDVKVIRHKGMVEGNGFTHFLPKTGWGPIKAPTRIAMAPDGSAYVIDHSSYFSGSDGYTIYNYHILKFNANGVFVSKWGGYGSGDGQFKEPQGIAIAPDGSVYVADSGNNRIQKFDGNGNFIAKWGSLGYSNGQLAYPLSIAIGPDGSVYVTDYYDRVQKFDNSGNFILAWGEYGRWDGQFKRPYGIAVSLDGFVYVVDTYNFRIQKFDSNGNFITTWGSWGYGTGQFYYPSDVAVAADGSVYVSDLLTGFIQKFDSNGIFIAQWGGYGEFIELQDLETGQDGSVYAVDKSSVKKFGSNGDFIIKWGDYGSADGQFNYPHGIAAASDGSVYVADTYNHRIQKFDNNGNFVGKWGTQGHAAGQFNYPGGIASAPDGSVYVINISDSRIQKFDGSGHFIAAWGDYGSNEGQFNYPYGIAAAADGSVYVADTYNNRIQKFDGHGNFIAEWGTQGGGNGQFYWPMGIAASSDGYVYVADTFNYRIQKFDAAGNFIAEWADYDSPFCITVSSDGFIYVAESGSIKKVDNNGSLIRAWGDYGSDAGQFNYPHGIAVGTDGTVYVADTANHRIQKMSGARDTEILFTTTIPVIQPVNSIQDYTTAAGAINVTGKLYLQATLKNSLGETIAASEYPFYIFDGNTALLISADKKLYEPGEIVAITGEIRNLASVDAANLKIEVSSQMAVETAQSIYTETLSVPAGGGHPFSFTTPAGSAGKVTFTGTVSLNGSILVESADQYDVTAPTLSMSLTGPDVVDRDPFDLHVEIKNTGKVNISGQLSVVSGQSQIDNQQITLPAGETKLLQYTQQIAANTTYSVSLMGDVNQTATKTVIFGEAAVVTFGNQNIERKCQPLCDPRVRGCAGGQICVDVVKPIIYPEGKIAIPVTISNTGQVDEALEVAYHLSGQGSVVGGQTKTYYLPKGGSVTDTLNYDLAEGSYQISAVSALPQVFAQSTFSVAKDNKISMTNTVGNQGTSGLIPVTVTVTNIGYNDINGSVQLTAIDNQGKAVWRGTAQVAGLKAQAAASYIINVDSTGITSGVYKAEIDLYSTSGQQLASNQSQVRVIGPIFEITSMPVYPTFTAGKQATFIFSLKNTGTQAGTTNFSVKAMDVLNQSITDTLIPGEERSHTFTFAVPEDAVENDYFADYALTSALSQGTKGQLKFHIAGVKIGVTATMDKPAYINGDMAVLNLSVSKLSQFEDGDYVAIIRYGSYHDMKPFTLTNQGITLTFSVPLPVITGENLFYSIHFQSGRSIYRNSIFINRIQPDLTIDNLSATYGSIRTYKLEATVLNHGDLSSEATNISFYDGDPSTGASPIATMSFPALSNGQSITLTTDWDVLGKGGSHSIYAVVDPGNAIIERIEVNNTQSVHVTVPSLTLDVSTTHPRYEANQDVGIAETVMNLTGSPYNDLNLITAVKDDGGSAVATLTNAIPALNPGEASYAGSWNTASNRSGNYTVTAWVSNGNPLTTASTIFEILPTVSAFGEMTLSSYEVVQGFPIDISYTLTNNGNLDITGGEVGIEVENKTTHTTATFAASTLEFLSVLSSTSGSFAIERVDIEPGEYTVTLTLKAGVKTMNISSKDLTVKPPLKVTKGISTMPRVLVWTKPAVSGQGSEVSNEPTTNEKLAVDALAKRGAYYKIVHSESAFMESMRSGYYNTYALLDTDKPTTDGLTSELVERVYGGDTLILTGSSNMDDIKVTEVTGTKFTGYLPDGIRTTTIGMPLYEQSANITIAGKAQKVTMTSVTAYVYGAVSDIYPSVIVNSYGKGKGVLVTFDLGRSAEVANDIATYSALFARIVGNTAPIETRLIPEGVAPVEITVESIGSAFDLRAMEKVDSRMAILDASLSGLIDAMSNTVTWYSNIGSSETARYLYLSGLSQFRGSYSTEAEVYYQDKGEYKLYNRYPLNIELTEGTAEIQNNILNAINLLNVTKDKQGIKDGIIKSFETLISKSSGTRKEIDEDIHDILKITDDVNKLEVDTDEIRAGLDDLLRILQRRWVLAR